MHEVDLRPIMEVFGALEDVVIIRDKISLAHRGCAFVTYSRSTDAMSAIEALHNKRKLPSASNPLQVRPATGQGHSQNDRAGEDGDTHKLFIGMIPKLASEDEIRHVFAQFGDIDEIYILRNQISGQSKGCAFLKFSERDAALAAISHVHEQYTMEGGNSALVVKFADSRRQRMNRARTQAAAANTNAYWQMPPGATIPFSQLQQMQQQYMQQLQQYAGAPGNAANAYGMYYNPYQYGNPSAAYGNLQNGAYDDSSAQEAALEFIPPPMVQTSFSAESTPRRSGSTSSDPGCPTGQLEGPVGANLFIYHLPYDLTDADLATAFSPFGTVLSAKVYMDKNTGESKGFGFVSYDAPGAADAAIASMNGFQIGPKRLKVQHKRVYPGSSTEEQVSSFGDDDEGYLEEEEDSKDQSTS